MTVRSSQRPSWLVWLPLPGAIVLTVGFLLGLGLQRQQSPLLRVVDDAQVAPNAFGVGSVEEILRYIEAKYVDPVERTRMVDIAVNGLLGQLDPFSSYISADNLGAHRARLGGTVEGTGLELGLIRDSVTVLSVVPNSPAAEAGVSVYDRVLRVGDSTLSRPGVTMEGVQDYLSSLPQGVVEVRLYRPGAGALAPISLPRRTLTLPTVGAGVMLPGKIAYIPIHQFADSTYEQFMVQMEELVERRGARRLLLDLRGNSGGYLEEAVQILSQFFSDAGRLLVFTEGDHAPRKEYKSTGRVLFPVEDIVILVDGGSASASEIVAGAIQDWDAGSVVGTPTFGKGLVQEMFNLKGEGVLHLTVSRYYLPSGRSIQRPYPTEFNVAPTGEEPREYKTAAGRAVFDGGGISPDVTVELDSLYALRRSPTVRRVVRELQLEYAELDSRLSQLTPEQLRAEVRGRLAATLSAGQAAGSIPVIAADIAATMFGSSDKTTGGLQRAELMRDPYVAQGLAVLRKR